MIECFLLYSDAVSQYCVLLEFLIADVGMLGSIKPNNGGHRQHGRW